MKRSFMANSNEEERYATSFANIEFWRKTRNETLTVGFLDMLKRIFTKYPFVSHYLKELDGKSTETFSHSVSVAFHMYALMESDGGFSNKDIFEWVSGALVHDAGKITTENAVLHSKVSFDDSDGFFAAKNAAFTQLMRHSIDGESVGERYRFVKRMMMAVVGHHIDASVWDKSGFEGATNSRKTWRQTFGEGYVESVLGKYFLGATDNDYEAIKLLSFVDSVQAMRSTERRYKNSFPWSVDPNFPEQKTVVGVLQKSAAEGKVDLSLAEMASEPFFQQKFDDLESMRQDNAVRRMVSFFSRDKKVPLYDDKIEDILKDPIVGAEFFTKVEAATEDKYVLTDQRFPGGALVCLGDLFGKSPPAIKREYKDNTVSYEDEFFER